MKVDLNGELIEAQDARVSPFDAGYMYGDGLFDTMRVYRGFPYLLGEHLQRLSRDAELLQIPFDADEQTWQYRIRDLLGANNLFEADARLRIQISRGGGHDIDQVTAEPEDLDPVVFVSTRAVSDRVNRIQIEGVRVLAM
jgi:branched-subunit amino acid aminotransferase/4-amino-4-deoxychorismate lyase